MMTTNNYVANLSQIVLLFACCKSHQGWSLFRSTVAGRIFWTVCYPLLKKTPKFINMHFFIHGIPRYTNVLKSGSWDYQKLFIDNQLFHLLYAYFICWVASFTEIQSCIVVTFNKEPVGGIMRRNEDSTEARNKTFVGVIFKVCFVNDGGIIVCCRAVQRQDLIDSGKIFSSTCPGFEQQTSVTCERKTPNRTRIYWQN